METQTTSHNKILIVDDDKFLLDMYSLKFKEKGFEVETAFGSINALSKLKEGNTYEALVLDLVMPTMDGFEFLEEAIANNLLGDTAVIILSNLGQQSDIERGKKLGAQGYIVKANSTPSEVVEKVLSIIEKNKKTS